MIELGFDTIGNATLICYDGKPVLVTDPWVSGSAYFGSWGLSHRIPDEQSEMIRDCEYVWFSHGHPDHLHAESLPLFQEKKILLPNHVGNRVYNEMKQQGYQAHILQDRRWYDISDHIKIMCIADYNQDAVLLVDMNGCLLVDANDALEEHGWGRRIRSMVRNYPVSFLLAHCGSVDSDMLHFYDENGAFIPPVQNASIGVQIARRVDYFGTTFFVPFSSLHRYQRRDSIWVNKYVPQQTDYLEGFHSQTRRLLPAFVRYNLREKSFEEINPSEIPVTVREPIEFGDSWSEPLERSDLSHIQQYCRSIEYVTQYLDFINFRVGKKDNIVEFKKKNFCRGLTFEVPRHSLMLSIRYEVFDDLLIGNFMKTCLHGQWPSSRLYPDFTPFVTKYADNGRVKSFSQLRSYFREYKRRDPVNFLYHRFEKKTKDIMRSYIPCDSKAYVRGKDLYYRVKNVLL